MLGFRLKQDGLFGQEKTVYSVTENSKKTTFKGHSGVFEIAT